MSVPVVVFEIQGKLGFARVLYNANDDEFVVVFIRNGSSEEKEIYVTGYQDSAVCEAREAVGIR